jgi:hypothetical protein
MIDAQSIWLVKLQSCNIKMIRQFTSNTSYFIVYEATCFGLYMTIIRPSYESSRYLLATRWDPNYVYN